MTPVEVLIETIQAAVRFGDSPELRMTQTAKLQAAILAAKPELLRPVDLTSDNGDS